MSSMTPPWKRRARGRGILGAARLAFDETTQRQQRTNHAVPLA
jgi:hypothetical protein